MPSLLNRLRSRKAAATPTIDPAIERLEGVVRAALELGFGGDLMPEEELRLHVGQNTTATNFWAQGSNSARRVVEVFGREPAGPVLDWGSGSGRTLNWLKGLPQWRKHYHACDVDAAAIDWLKQKGFANAAVCGDNPPLPYPDGYFAGVFAFSVLTHIPPASHDAWYREIARVLAPGGRAYLTIQGEVVIKNGMIHDQAKLAEYQRSGNAYIEMSGHYKSAALVSPGFTKDLVSKYFDLIDYQSPGYQNMDSFLLAKR